MRKIIIAVVGILFLGTVVLMLLGGSQIARAPFTSSPDTTLPTYFTYSEEERAPLRDHSSEYAMDVKDLSRWSDTAFELTAKNTVTSDFKENTAAIYAYLTVAQRDAAYLSYNMTGAYTGSLAPISKQTLCLFFTNDCDAIRTVGETDAYSEALASIVIAKMRTRIAEDTAHLRMYPEKIGPEYWNLTEGRIGQNDGSRKTWLITSGDQFRAPHPPPYDSEEFALELAITKKALTEITEKQKQAVVFWAGGPGTKTPPGIWLNITEDYITTNAVPIEKALLVRSMLGMAVADANTAVFDSKWTYWVKRPFMRDSEIHTIMPTPNHPSYPAGHSTLSSAAATILNYYFPESRATWVSLGEEGGMSRVWGGIHYMMDHHAGNRIGTRVAEEGIRYAESH